MSARERILDAAADIMRTQGVARATTKEIARAAGYSEALIYKHFRDKEELLSRVLLERMPSFTESLRPGEGTVAGNLTAFAHNALRFYRRAFPMMASFAAQPALIAASRANLERRDAGPRCPIDRLGAYLAAERDLGRLGPGADPEALAALLVGACFQQGFLRYFAVGPEGDDLPESVAAALVQALSPALG
ncbi:TetR/AcrR family transcriptional regulator [Actinomadura kijaniata]|uniref:AcrR family transcriptional regulator n=1 Tax=Actinomadura namibiensis TaxID=182080 RepID=A0A7W3LSS9_ACTNM|nr:TetR/AcrR family transcriptional regulator [Actinomadura namibiensis]MBA8953658.1 AcrR family transcriptional regulator [Actinomadura namibiensis]